MQWLLDAMAIIPVAFAAETDFDRLPWWVRAIAIVGVPSAIACALTWFLVTAFAGDLRATRANTDAAIRNHSAIMDREQDILNQLMTTQANDTRIEKYLLAMCLNGAKSDVERDRCMSK